MIVGIPKEIKNNEYRVSLTPAGAMELVRRGHTVYIQSGAGVDSGFADKEYQAVGAKLLPSIEEVYATAEMIIKVKEPIAPEYGLVRPGQLLFTYFHFASSEALTRAMIASGAVCCAYETVERSDRSLPLLIPMSEVAGRMAAQEGRYFLEKPRGGKGILLGGVPGVKPAKVFVIGAGVVGTAAARTAAGTGGRGGADSGCQGAEAGDARHVETDGAGYGHGRRSDRSGRLLRDVAAYDARGPRLLCGRHPALLCGQYSGCGALYLDAGAHQCHAALCLATGRQGVAARLRRERRAAARSEHRRREGRLPLGGRSVGASLRAAAKLIRTVSDDPAARRRPDPFAETGCFSGSAAGPDRAGVGTCAGVRGSVCVFARICLYSPL